MPEKINKTYKPEELKAAIDILKNNCYHNFEDGDAAGIVKALFNAGFRIVKC